MKLHNTYFGFTNNKTALQAGKIEKSLDMLWNYDGKTYLRKVLVFELLQAGRKPKLEKNYSYYSAKIDDYTKPKTLYKLEDQEGTYIELNKTLYDYAIYLVENDLINNDKANQFIENEENEKAEAIKREKEQADKERREAEEKRTLEQEESKRRLELKQAEWRKVGTELLSTFEINPITDLLNEKWEEIQEVYPGMPKDEFFRNAEERLLLMIGNQAYSIHHAQYFVENEQTEDYRRFSIKSNPSMYLEKELLYRLFDLSNEDSKRTIAAKIKAVYEMRKYKGKGSTATTEKEEKTFYWYNAKDKVFVPVSGEELIIGETKLFIYKANGRYNVSEAQSGLLVAYGDTKEDAKNNCMERIRNYSSKIDSAVRKAVSTYGISPLYSNELSEAAHG